MADMGDITRIFHSFPTLNAFEICHSGGCAELNQVLLNQSEWQKVRLIFNQPSQNTQQNAQQERAQVSQAIGLLEEIIGQKIGTAGDLAGTFNNSDFKGQLDCNDEAINTTTYLRLLKQNGLMPLHDIEDMRTRNFFFTGWPHSTAVIHDIKTNERYAVDSWFYDNGHAAVIVPFKQWKANFKPSDSPVGVKKSKTPVMQVSVPNQ